MLLKYIFTIQQNFEYIMYGLYYKKHQVLISKKCYEETEFENFLQHHIIANRQKLVVSHYYPLIIFRTQVYYVTNKFVCVCV